MKRAHTAVLATQKVGLSKRAFLVRLAAARDNAQAGISAARGDSKYGRGLSTEGYVGGYLAALDDVDAMLRHGYPADQRGFWKEKDKP